MQEFLLNNLITILFIIFVIYNFVRGFHIGLVKKILSIGTIILTIIATRFFTPIVASAVKDATNIEATLTAFIYDNLLKGNDFNSLNIPFLKDAVNTGNVESTMRDVLCNNIANAVINLLCGIVVFISVLLIIKILIKVFVLFNYIPVIGELNKILGGAFGVIEVLIIVSIIFTILRVLENISPINTIVENIKKSPIVGNIYENNVIFNYLSGLFSNLKSA